jgi:hypothetical protein
MHGMQGTSSDQASASKHVSFGCIPTEVLFVNGMLLQDPNAKAGKFGFAVDNAIGATPQPNGWMDDWVDFYRERRIKHQLQLLGTLLPTHGSLLARVVVARTN